MTGITVKQERAIELLLAPGTKTYEGIALAVGISDRTLRRWMADGTFKSAFDQARREVFEVNIAGLASLTGLAVGELKRIVSDPASTNREKLYACRTILATAQNASAADVERLIDRLEAALEGSTS